MVTFYLRETYENIMREDPIWLQKHICKQSRR